MVSQVSLLCPLTHDQLRANITVGSLLSSCLWLKSSGVVGGVGGVGVVGTSSRGFRAHASSSTDGGV